MKNTIKYGAIFSVLAMGLLAMPVSATSARLADNPDSAQ